MNFQGKGEYLYFLCWKLLLRQNSIFIVSSQLKYCPISASVFQLSCLSIRAAPGLIHTSSFFNVRSSRGLFRPQLYYSQDVHVKPGFLYQLHLEKHLSLMKYFSVYFECQNRYQIFLFATLLQLTCMKSSQIAQIGSTVWPIAQKSHVKS